MPMEFWLVLADMVKLEEMPREKGESDGSNTYLPFRRSDQCVVDSPWLPFSMAMANVWAWSCQGWSTMGIWPEFWPRTCELIFGYRQAMIDRGPLEVGRPRADESDPKLCDRWNVEMGMKRI